MPAVGKRKVCESFSVVTASERPPDTYSRNVRQKAALRISDNNSTACPQNGGIMHVEFYCLRSKLGASSRRGGQAPAQKDCKAKGGANSVLIILAKSLAFPRRTPLAVSGVNGLSNFLGTRTFSLHLHANGALQSPTLSKSLALVEE